MQHDGRQVGGVGGRIDQHAVAQLKPVPRGLVLVDGEQAGKGLPSAFPWHRAQTVGEFDSVCALREQVGLTLDPGVTVAALGFETTERIRVLGGTGLRRVPAAGGTRLERRHRIHDLRRVHGDSSGVEHECHAYGSKGFERRCACGLVVVSWVEKGEIAALCAFVDQFLCDGFEL